MTVDELEAHHRTAVMLRYQLECDPKQFAKGRESVLSPVRRWCVTPEAAR